MNADEDKWSRWDRILREKCPELDAATFPEKRSST